MKSAHLRRGGVLLSILLLVLWYLLAPRPDGGDRMLALIDTLVTRGLCSAVFLLTLIELRTPILGIRRTPLGQKPLASCLICLPWLAIAVNNLPILPLLDGSARVDATPAELIVFALGCFFIGLFEEAAFRGFVFLQLLHRMGTSPLRVFLSIVLTSGIFGLIHLVNLFEGASPFAVLLQVGYSFLIGGMCAIALLKTGTLWVPVFLHALYDFNGFLVPTLGEGVIWTGTTIALTAMVALAVAIYTVFVLLGIKGEEAARCLEGREEECAAFSPPHPPHL